MRLLILVLALGVIGGCALSQEERQFIVDAAAEKAGQKAAAIAYEEAIKRGLSDEDAKKVSELARGVAAEEARRLAEKAIPAAETEKRSGWEKIVASAFMLLVQLGLGLKKGGTA